MRVMRTSSSGVALIKRFEGLELEAYQDIAGIWTIGYGHTGPDVTPGLTISESEAEALLRDDLRRFENGVDRAARVSLNQNEFDALVSFSYNVGVAAMQGSTAIRRLNRGDRMGAADALTWWNKATVDGVLREVRGLTRRRAAERALFLTPVNPFAAAAGQDELDDNSRVAPIEDPPRRSNPADSRTIQGATIAGGAGVTASTMGRDNAEELNQLETNIQNGEGMTEDPEAGEGSSSPAGDLATDTPGIDDDDQNTGEDDGGSNTEPDAVVCAETVNAEGEEEVCAPTVELDENGDIVAEDDFAENGEIVSIDDMRPSKHESHEVEAQLQLALLVLIVLSVLFIVYARLDDWLNYRR